MFIVSIVVLPSTAEANDFTVEAVPFNIASQLILLFQIVYCTAAPLFQIGRRFQTGYNAPIIDTKSHHVRLRWAFWKAFTSE